MSQYKTLIYISLVIALFLILLTLAVESEAILPFDRQITFAVQSFHPAIWGSLMAAVSWPGYPPQTFLVYGLWLLCMGLLWGKKGLIVGIIGLGATALTGELFKVLVNRLRPDEVGIYVAQRGLEGGRYSFPAGHVEAITVVGLLTLWMVGQTVRDKNLVRVLLIVILILMILMGVSRVYLGEHWFSDVIGGYLIGLFWTCATIVIARRWLSELRKS
jgi:undecaprenyl-diphosphatase